LFNTETGLKSAIPIAGGEIVLSIRLSHKPSSCKKAIMPSLATTPEVSPSLYDLPEDAIFVSVIIAAYNEENRICPSLLKISEYLCNNQLEHEIIVVDDGSSDGTSEVAGALSNRIQNLKIIRYPLNRGKGYALRQGVLASKGTLVLLTDADLSTPIEELEKLSTSLIENNCRIAIGSRALARSEIIVKQPWMRQKMGKIFNRIIRVLVLDGFSDTQCGFKLFSGNIARQLFKVARIDRFAYDVEILALAKKKGLMISEVPIKWNNSFDSKVNPIFDSLQMLKDIFKIRMLLRMQETSPKTLKLHIISGLKALIFLLSMINI
jgi:dolichyl-phosphate beta-glucosyltransferase